MIERPPAARAGLDWQTGERLRSERDRLSTDLLPGITLGLRAAIPLPRTFAFSDLLNDLDARTLA